MTTMGDDVSRTASFPLEATMKCDACQTSIAPGDERKHLGQTLCEDCYMVALSPMKACDPWAVHSAKRYEKLGGGERKLTARQDEILQILATEGPMAPTDLQAKLSRPMPLEKLEREFAALRHMEKARAARQGARVLWRLW
jgi:hypothetical protein